MTDATHDPMDRALARAVVYRTLAIAFQPPTDTRLAQIGARSVFPVLTAATASADDPSSLQRAAARLAALPVADTESVASTYWRLFGHTTRGLICACETEYGPDNGFHQPQQLADITGYFLAFGLRPATATDSRADHVACECEFMEFLSRKEAFLLDRLGRGRGVSRGRKGGRDKGDGGDTDTLAVTEEAARTFLRDHLGRFGRAFAARVATEDRGGYFGAFGQLLLAFLDDECSRMGIEAGPIDLVVQPESIDDTPMACGSAADELIQIRRHP